MHCPIRVADTTSNELKLLTTTYGLSLEALLRISLDFVALLMLDRSGNLKSTSAWNSPSARATAQTSELKGACCVRGEKSADAAAEDAAKPAGSDFLSDFCSAVLPAHLMRIEIHRVSAILEDTVLHLRAQRLQIEAFGDARALALGSNRKIESHMDPATTVREKNHYVTLATLGLLEAVNELKQSGRLVMGSCVPIVGSDVANPEFPSWVEAKRRGLTLTRADVERWLPMLQRYGWVRPVLTIGEPLQAADAGVVVAAFSCFLSRLTEAICYLYSVTEELPCQAYREDLLVIHLRARQNAQALEQRLHEIEVGVHLVNNYSGPLTEKALILASKVGPGEAIFAAEDAVPAVVENRRAKQSEDGSSSAMAAVTYLSPNAEVV